MTTSLPEPQGRLLDVREVSAICHCSVRHVYRMADAGKMPPPVKLGALVRWRAAEVEAWIAGGCRPVRSVAAKRVAHHA
ncbi:MAG TPA: helix-turn-helix domain-containing protein [Pirellulaceae bacterium]|nr:helix-turn-helix domain-containing protein [Pirellulaceae bacterium]